MTKMARVPKFIRIPEIGWHSGTSVHPFFLHDPVLSFYEAKLASGEKSKGIFQKFIMRQGLDFEAEVIQLMKLKIGPRNVKIIAEDLEDARSDRKAATTFREMRKGTPIICSAVVQNPENQTFGLPDFLIRHDYLSKVISEQVPLEPGFSPNLGKPWYYVAVDAKFTTLQLAADGVHLLNANRNAAYKAQVAIYNLALAYMQGFDPQKAYILGRRWKFTKCGEKFQGNSCFDRLGEVDFASYDAEIPKRLSQALDWLNLVNSAESDDWNYQKYPLSHPHLYPNMCNAYDEPWTSLKKEIAQRNGELTSLWMVGVKNREYALERKVTNWKSDHCNAKLLGIKNRHGEILDLILKANRGKRKSVLPRKLRDSKQEWLEIPELEFYVDFEAWDSSLAPCKGEHANCESVIYMIGVYNNLGDYKCFIAERIDKPSEKKIVEDFMSYVRGTIARRGLSQNEVNCVHWSQYEPIAWKKVIKEHRLSDCINWFDLLDVFKGEPIAIKGALGYSLKEVAKALYRNKMISSTWSEDMNGLDSMVLAQMAEEKAISDGQFFFQTEETQRIVDYNRTDVVVLAEIIDFLRATYAD